MPDFVWLGQKTCLLVAMACLFCDVGFDAFGSRRVNGQDQVQEVLPESGVVVWRIQPSKISKASRFQLLPWESLSALSSDSFGLDLLRCSHAYGAIGIEANSGWDFSLRFVPQGAADIENLKPQRFGPTRVSQTRPDTRLRVLNNTAISVVQVDKQWLAGSEKSLRMMLAAHAKPHRLLPQLLEREEAIVMALDLPQLKPNLPILLEALEMSPFSEEAILLSQCCSAFDYVILAVNVGENCSLEIQWVAKDPAMSKANGELVEKFLKRLGGVLSSEYRKAMDVDGLDFGLGPAVWNAYFARLSDTLSQLVQTEFRENVIVTKLVVVEEIVSLASVLVMSFAPLDLLAKSFPKPETESNLGILADALHSYEAVHRRIPPRIIKNQDGKPLLSWRVLMLPFIGEEELYLEFRLNEPWDSEHNKKLVEMMPRVYANPNADIPLGHTTYLAPFGLTERREQTIWDIEPLLLRQVGDGLSNTCAIVEVNPSASVPWSKPEDFNLTERELIEHLGEPPAGGLIVTLDTTCYDFSTNKEKNKLKAVMSSNGGEAVVAPF